jgi:hypothetical protein
MNADPVAHVFHLREQNGKECPRRQRLDGTLEEFMMPG